MRQILEQHTVFFAARFVLAAIQYQIARLARRFAGELPFFAGGKSRAAAAAQAGIRNNFDNFFAEKL